MTMTQSLIHILVCPENAMRGIYGYSDILVLKVGEERIWFKVISHFDP